MSVYLLTRRALYTCALLFALLLLGRPAAVHAQSPDSPPVPGPVEPPAPHLPERADGLYQTPDGLWASPGRAAAEEAEKAPDAAADTGGPDAYGYTWDNAVPFAWVDAGGGQDAGVRDYPVSEAIDIGFPFKFYENTYTQVYIAKYGYLTLDDYNDYDPQSPVPDPSIPNNVIAPYWVPAYDGYNYIRYLRGGSAPNRWFVVEWNQLESDCCGDDEEIDTYTFQVKIEENGNITFSYADMLVDGGYWCQSSGIEDAMGLDGLAITEYCDPIDESYHGVVIYRPAPGPRVKIFPPAAGKFTRPGEEMTFNIPIRNLGETGTDTYDLIYASFWPVSFYAADGETLLTDTDGDGRIDTGSVSQGATAAIVAQVTAPADAVLEDYNITNLTAISSLDPGKTANIVLRSAIPAPFAQTYVDEADGAMRFDLIQPHGLIRRAFSPNDYDGFDPAIIETADGNFFQAWSKQRCADLDCSIYVTEIEYAFADQYGEITHRINKLTSHAGATLSTRDWGVAVAAASDEKIGLLWRRYLWNNETEQYNYNMYFAVIDESGAIRYGPVNLTANTVWGNGDDFNVPGIYDAHIIATEDNRFVLTWAQNYQAPPTDNCDSSCYVRDVIYAVRSSTGQEVYPATFLTNDEPGWDNSYVDPDVTKIGADRAIITFANWGDEDVYYAVIDSSGAIVKENANLVGSGTDQSDYQPDAVELSNGNVLIAWDSGAWGEKGFRYEIHFAVLDRNYNRIIGPTSIANPAARTGNSSVSVTADDAGHAILTWMEEYYNYRPNLFYALVDSNGNIVTPAMIFLAGQSDALSIRTNTQGYGNTSYSWAPPDDVDGMVSLGQSVAGGMPGGVVAIPVTYANYGNSVAEGVTISVTLAAELTYLADSSGVDPTLDGNTLSWALPSLALLERETFYLNLLLPEDAEYGARYAVTAAFTSAGPEADAADNEAESDVMAARRTLLPVIMQ
ncbi:MAG: hypothetical protein H6642_00310 [Caldilineaceae bacterium]|nr:hypothetical protein [Caldilineaceae bacterium]